MNTGSPFHKGKGHSLGDGLRGQMGEIKGGEQLNKGMTMEDWLGSVGSFSLER